nr:dimethylargininase [Phytoactinopolyspora alkaliphila]
MDPSVPVDADRALAQWRALRRTYEGLGHRVDVLEPLLGMPDMVFTANGALVIGERALGARFRAPGRAGEAPAHRRWLTDHGVDVRMPREINEGEGDFAWTGRRILAGSGFRTSPAACTELAEVFDVPVAPLHLVDPRFYHLDTALAVLDDRTIVYYPAAFSDSSQRLLASLYPEAIIATADDALVLGLNAVSDGTHVVLARQAEKLAAQIAERGYVPVPVDVSELLKSGGGVKCATLELHRATTATPAGTAGDR